MHEVAIVEALLDAVRGELRAHPTASVTTVRVRVGALRQIVPDVMTFCFNAAIRDTNLAGASLEVEQVPGRARCRQCRAEFAVEENWFVCPLCRSSNTRLLAGDELLLASIELDAVANDKLSGRGVLSDTMS
jgi:hydrogenase nickel incorporation protein HypA/HybF